VRCDEGLVPHIAIEEGASLKGSVLVQKDIPSPRTKKEGEAAIAKKLI